MRNRERQNGARRRMPSITMVLLIGASLVAVTLAAYAPRTGGDEPGPRTPQPEEANVAGPDVAGQGNLHFTVSSPADVRAMVSFCDTAEPTDRDALLEP